MIWHSISPILRVLMLAGALCYLGIILCLLKKRRLTVRYALLWLLSAAAFLLFAVFPYIVLVLTNLLGMTVPINTVFILVTVFVLLLLLSLSSAVSTHAQKQKRLAQENALLEARVRQLEERIAELEK